MNGEQSDGPDELIWISQKDQIDVLGEGEVNASRPCLPRSPFFKAPLAPFKVATT